ncbi:MAG: ABC transporter substrate-binding protein, partial [Mesorhizobium sp.]|nr:ABC transporter substrate-binding protein [Mesorhizobium sp.]
MRMHRRTLLALAVFTGLTAPSMALAADDTIKIGLLATFEGPFTVLGEDGERGAMTAVNEMNGTVAGKKVEIVKGSSDAAADSAVCAARKL